MNINNNQTIPRQDYPVFIVDDEESARESLGFMLEGYGFNITAFDSGTTFLNTVDLSKLGCLILDSRMPDLRGPEVQEILNNKKSPLSVIFLTGHGDIPMAVEALKNGAIDFFQKPVDSETLVLTIEKGSLIAHKKYQDAEIKRIYFSLTAREQEILSLIIKGLKNQEMADELCVSLRTIEVHRSNLMKKLGVTRVVDLILRYGNFQPLEASHT